MWNKLTFIIGDSMLKDVDEYPLRGSINCKLLLKWDLFHWEKYRLCKLILNPRKMNLTMLWTVLHVWTIDLTLSDIPEQITEHIFDTVL